MNGRWLGDYNELTLVKGLFFPLFLAINGLFGIPYSISVPGFYTIACVLFIFGTKNYLKTNCLFIFFAVLMFMPISFANETFTRVYRNSLIAGQVLMIAGSLVALYLNRFEKNKILIILSLLFSGLAVASLWHSRKMASGLFR